MPLDIYVRVSRVGAREHLRSPEDQEREARSFARAHHVAVGDVFTDLDHSGGSLDRPGLQQCLQRVEGRVSGGIIVAYLSRASRDTQQGLSLLERVTAAGGAVYAPNLPDYTTADGKMLTTIQLAVDTGYRERKREELERAKAGAIAAGIPIHSRPPAGYRARADRRLEPDPGVAPVIREVFERRAQGDGPVELAELLQSKRVKTSQGSKNWSKQAVYGLLANRTYLGEISYGKDRRFVNRAAHEAIIDLATWQAAQHPNGKLAKPRSAKQPYLLSGIARCQACGFSLQGTTTSRGKRVYRCQRRHAGGTCPASAWMPAPDMEGLVLDAFWRLVDDIGASGESVNNELLEALQKALDRAELRLQQFLSPAVQDEIGDTPEWAVGLGQRRSARDEAARTFGKAQAEAARKSKGVPSETTLRRQWMSWGTLERREALAAYLDCVALCSDRSLVIFRRGEGPVLPGPGFRREPRLWPIELPADARLLAA